MRKQLLFYIVMIFSFVVLLAVILHLGTGLQVAIPSQGTFVESPSTHTIQHLFSSFQQPLTILLLQIVVIIVVARVTGFLFEKINQP